MTEKAMPLCPAQALIALMEDAFPGTNGNTIAFTFRLPPGLSDDHVERVLNRFLEVQEASRLRVRNGEQVLEPHAYVMVPRHDLTTYPGGWRAWVAERVLRPMPLDGSLLCEGALLQTVEGPIALVKAHHLISDNGTFRVLCRNLYAALCEGRELEPPSPTYRDFLKADAEYLASPEAAADRAWWMERMKSPPEPASLSGSRRPSTNPASAHRVFRLPAGLRTRLQEFCTAHKTTHVRVMLTVLAAYLGRVSGESDVILGVPFHNRPPGYNDTAGMFVNPLAVRIDVTESRTFLEVLEGASRELKGCVQHGRYPYGQLVRDLKADTLYRYSLVQSSPASDVATRTLKPEFWPPSASPEHLALCLNPDTPDELGLSSVRCEYRTELFDANEVERLFARLMGLLEAALDAPETPLSALPALTADERTLVLDRFNEGRSGAPRVPTYMHLWNAAVAAHPDRVALVHGARSLTYRELDARVRRLSCALRARGVGHDVAVPILVERSPEFVVAALAVMRAGGGYLPVDPGYPASRVQFMLTDSAAKIVLTQQSLTHLLEGFSGEVLDLYDPALEATAPHLEWPPGSGSDLAYIIYTSGSTGTPKGVMLEQRNLVSFVSWQRGWFELGPSDAQAHYYSFSFDAAVGSLFTPLTVGAAVHVIPEEIRLSIEGLNTYFEKHRITIADLPTQLAEQFMEWADNRSLRWMLTGGDRLKTFRPRRYTLVNEYGPTEVTVSATQFAVTRASDNIPIGRPLGGVWAYVLDRASRPLPLGLPGELCLAGHQVARGYLNRPDLTAEKFVANPFASGPENARMYRTGDLVRWLPDGTLEFLGRIDQQVKIRGFRIELGEIEQRLAEVEGVTAAAVIAADDAAGATQLYAYVTTQEGVDLGGVKAALGGVLPAYMLPKSITRLSEMPYSTSGKIDRKALPKPVENETAAEIVAPRTESEERLAALWREVLGLPRLGVTEDFFALGGDSLKVTVLSAKMQRAWGRGVAVSELFRFPTIEKLAAHLDRAPRDRTRPIDRQPDAGSYTASAAQERLFVMEGLEGIGSAYVLPAEMILEGPLDRERLSFTFDRLVERHEALRTSLELVDGQLTQRVHRTVKYKKLFREILEEDAAEQLAELSRPFELDAAPLFRLGLYQLGPNRHLLALAMHHAISDGISTEVLLDEWLALYAGQELAPLSLDYRDYAAWHRRLLESGDAKGQEEFWAKQLAGPLAVLELPLDRPRPAAKTYAGRVLSMTVEAPLAAKLRELATGSGGTLYMLMMSAFAALLGRHASQSEVLIGTPFSGRSHPDLERMVGMFVNTLPVRAYPDPDKPFRQLFDEVRALCVDIGDNQDYPFDRMVETLGVRRDPSRNPIFDVMFGLLSEERKLASDLRLSRFHRDRGAAHFDLTLEAVYFGEGQPCRLEWEYATALFDEATIRRMSGHYVRILEAIVDDPDIKIGDIDILTPAERKQVLVDFNDTALPYDRGTSTSRAFTAASLKFPEKPALVFREQVLTFSELSTRVDRLAGHLQALGLGRDGIAAVMVERSADLVIAALAAMRAGGAYLPIDAAYPQSRVEYMLSDSGAKLLLTQRPLAARSDGWGGTRVFLDEPIAGTSPATDVSKPEDLAYVIYTSGSTGKPKGVLIEHRNLLCLCAWVKSFHTVTDADVAATFSGFGFDASVWEIFPFLLAGCTLHVVADELRLSPPDLAAYFERHGVTITNLPTQLAEQFMELPGCQGLKTLVTGGDKLKSFKKHAYRLVNEYGPTEYTVSSTAFVVDRMHDNIPIGKPLGNTWAYVLDRRGNPQPVGVAGELCIAGAQMARGYLGRPELTAEKFVANPHATGPDNQRMYRTGDLARWRPDGNIEFLGRIDSQVKIRGYRIELGEIEQQLLKCAGVSDAVVVDLPDAAGQPYLAAYVVSRSFDAERLRKELSGELPDYMVPAHFIALDAIPLNANGKIDRPRLPRPEAPAAAEYVEPATPEERDVAEVWIQVLGLKRAGALDNFFDLGGTSIKAISVVARLRQRYQVTINDVFAHQVLRDLAKVLQPMEDGLKARLLRLKDELATEAVDPPEASVARAKYAAGHAPLRALDLGQPEPWGHVVLTGATGYLGAYLLRALLDAGAARVTALVRGASDADARNRVLAKAAYYFGPEHRTQLEAEARFRVLAADLGKPLLGLAAGAYQELASDASAAVHAAANVRHFGHYEEFHEANVLSVEGLVELCRTGREKALHHISTVSVGDGHTPGRAYALFTEDDPAITGHDNHYLRSKGEGEAVVERARQAGLAASIYRVGNIVWDSVTGRYQENLDENAFFQRIKAFLDIGAVPHDARVAEELSHVDAVARAILTLAARPALRGRTWHLYNPDWQRVSRLLDEPSLGLRLEHLSFPKFLDFLVQHVDKPGFRGPIETVLTHLDLLEEARERTKVEVPADRTVTVLERLGFAWPKPDPARMAPMVERALDERVRFLREASPFAAAGDPGLRALARVARPRHFSGERHVTWEGEPNEEVHLITHGLAALSRTAPGGWTGTVCVVKPRDVIGLESALGQAVAQAIAEPAMGDLVVLSIPAPAVRAVLMQHALVSLELLRELARNNDRLQRLVVSMG